MRISSAPPFYSQVAQPVEQPAVNGKVVGAKPTLGANLTTTGCSLKVRHLIWDQGQAGALPVIPTNQQNKMNEDKQFSSSAAEFDRISNDLRKTLKDFIFKPASKKTLAKLALVAASNIERDCKSIVQDIKATTQWIDTPWYKKAFMFVFQRKKMWNSKSIVNIDITMIRPRAIPQIHVTWNP